MCPSRPYKYGRACIYGHLWEIARITPVFLWFCPYFLQKSARIFTKMSPYEELGTLLKTKCRPFEQFGPHAKCAMVDWIYGTQSPKLFIRTHKRPVSSEIGPKFELNRETFWILISRYWFVLFLHSGLPAVSVYQFSVGWILCFLKWTFDCLIFGV